MTSFYRHVFARLVIRRYWIFSAAVFLSICGPQRDAYSAQNASSSQKEAYCANVVFDRKGGYGSIAADALANPSFCGIDILMDWADVEPVPNQFNFAPADKVAKTWSEAGKFFVVVIRFTNEYPRDCAKPQALPPWVIERVAHLCDGVFGSVIPNYFDPTFNDEFQRYVRAVAKHFEGSPYRGSLLYVRGAVGLGSEGFYLRTCPQKLRACDRQPERAQMQKWGITQVSWAKWQKRVMEVYGSAFHYSTVVYPLVPLGVDPTTGNLIQDDMAMWAAERGFGLGALGLRPGFGRGSGNLSVILQRAIRRVPKVFIQLQTFGPVKGAEELQIDIDAANLLGAKTIEWYATDVSVPEYQPFFDQWSQMVRSTH